MKCYKLIKSLIFQKRNTEIFKRFILFGKLSQNQRMKTYVENIFNLLKKYKNFKLKINLRKWLQNGQKIKNKNAMRIIIALMRKNFKIKGKLILKSYHYVQKFGKDLYRKKVNELLDSFLFKRLKNLKTVELYETKLNATDLKFITKINKSVFSSQKATNIKKFYMAKAKQRLLSLVNNSAKTKQIGDILKQIFIRNSFKKLKNLIKTSKFSLILKRIISNRSNIAFIGKMRQIIEKEKSVNKILNFSFLID